MQGHLDGKPCSMEGPFRWKARSIEGPVRCKARSMEGPARWNPFDGRPDEGKAPFDGKPRSITPSVRPSVPASSHKGGETGPKHATKRGGKTPHTSPWVGPSCRRRAAASSCRCTHRAPSSRVLRIAERGCALACACACVRACAHACAYAITCEHDVRACESIAALLAYGRMVPWHRFSQMA